ncbi:MAG: DUF6785 family protein [Candidatus Bathyarchaeia archaeon]
MSKNLSEKLEGAGLTPRILIFSILWCIINTVVFGALLVATNTNLMIPMFILLAAEAVLTRIVNPKYQFTPQEWAVFFSIAMSGLMTTPAWETGDMWHSATNIAFLRAFIRVYSVNFETWHTLEAPVPDLWIVKDPEAIDAYLYGGSVPWSSYLPPILFYIVNWASLYLAFHFLAIIFRKPWVETERLPFPWQRPLYESLKSAKGLEGRPSLWNIRQNAWFWAGFLLGAISASIDVLAIWFGIYIPTMTEFQKYEINLSPYLGEIFPSNLWVLGWESWAVAATILMPMDVLNTAIIFWILLEGICVWINFVTGSTPAGDYWTNGVETGIIKHRLMFVGRPPGAVGPVLIALPLIFIWRARRQIARSIKAAISGTPREEGEPHSWRTVWIGFISCFIIWYISMVASGAPPYIVWTFIMLAFFFIFSARWCAETGGVLFPTHNLDQHYNIFYDTIPLQLAGKLGLNTESIATTIYAGNWYHWWVPLIPMEPTLVGFKFAQETKTSTRDISIAIIIATLIGVVVAVPLGIWMFHYWGASVLYERMLELGGVATTYEGWPPLVPFLSSGQSWLDFYTIPDMPIWWIAGFVVVIIIEVLRSKFAWFFLNPIGIVVGSGAMCEWFYDGNLVIAWIIKQVSLRVLGGKGYERIIVPIACGLMIGYGVFFMLLQIPPTFMAIM